MEEIGIMESAGNFAKLPEEVMNHLFEFVDYNDCLRMRRTCKFLRDQVNIHLHKKTRKNRGKRTSNSYVDITMQNATEVQLPVSKVYLRGNVNVLMKDPSIAQFLKRHGAAITHLKFDALEVPIYGEERLGFYNAFTNLESFECKSLRLMGAGETMTNLVHIIKKSSGDGFVPVTLVPKSFHKLKRFVVERVYDEDRQEELDTREDLSDYLSFWDFYKILNKHANLEEFGFPHLVRDEGSEASIDEEKTLQDCIRDRLESNRPNLRVAKLPLPAVTNKTYELSAGLVQVCNQAGVKLENVATSQLNDDPQNVTKAQGTVASLRSVDSSSWFTVQFPHLVQARLKYTNILFTDRRQLVFAEWPSLKALQVWVDPERPPWWERWSAALEERELILSSATHLIRFVCGSVVRPKLEALYLDYAGDYFPRTVLPVPNALDISRTCANLKYLALRGVPGNNAFFNGIWAGLPLLEYVEIMGCPSLGDAGFTGNEGGLSPFSALQNLKYLELTGLSEMLISGRLLETVIRHMPLRFLRLASGFVKKHDYDEEVLSPPSVRFLALEDLTHDTRREVTVIDTITLANVRSLTSGRFAETIERLDISRLCLIDVPQEEMANLESEFRSSNMI